MWRDFQIWFYIKVTIVTVKSPDLNISPVLFTNSLKNLLSTY